MKERPILMTPENAQKCFEGVKTQTRRIINPQPPGRIFEKYGCWNSANFEGEWVCKFGEVGDRLWIREAFTYWEYEEPKKKTKSVRWEDLTPKQQENAIEQASHVGEDYLVYKGGGAKRSLSEWQFPHPIYDHCIGQFGKTIPSVHMPRWACRTVVELTEIRVQRVQDITAEDCLAEGVDCNCLDGGFDVGVAFGNFVLLWESINGPGSWEENLFVWALTFKKV